MTTPLRRQTSPEDDSESNPWRQSALNKPRFRGVLHQWAFVISVPLGVIVAATAGSGRHAFAAAVFAFGVSFMLGVSALFHRQEYTPEGWFSFRRMDHTGIYMAIATGFTPLAMLGLTDSWQRTMVLAVGWTGASLGIALRWLPFKPPYGMMTGLFIVLSWSVVVAAPAIWRNNPTWVTVLLGVGGLFYTFGAFVVGSRRPDPWPNTFGYHEIWHTCVVIAVCCHYCVLIFGWL